MATFTRNLFYGSGTGQYKLSVLDGAWPKDIEGAAYVVGPDKAEPGGHWLAHHGYIHKIDCKADSNGQINIVAKRVDTPLNRLRNKLPKVFGKMSALEFSPFGISNLANTNLQILNERMFVGYDVGRPVEVDPETLDFVSPVGANNEWMQAVPALLLLEPQISVAAHPAADYENQELYFVNYSQVPTNDGLRRTLICKWDMEGKIQRWPIANMSGFDTIHDIKCTRNYLVFTDLPFIVEPANVYGKARKHANQDICQMWIVAKKDIENTPEGEPVHAQYIRINCPAGHIKVDNHDDEGIITVYLQHIPATDLGLVISPHEKKHLDKEAFHSDFEGMISIGPQPNATGKHVIDVKAGKVVESTYCWDKHKHWNSLLWTDNIYSEQAREKSAYLWATSLGFDPAMVMESAYQLYKDAPSAFVPLKDLPEQAIAPSICRINLESMQYDDSYEFAAGTFAHPPTFIPRINARSEDDGYIMVFVNKDKPKEIQLFDAANLSQGPVVRVASEDFNPPVLLHTTWKAPVQNGRQEGRQEGRRSHYKVSMTKDLLGALVSWPKTAVFFIKHAKNMNKRFEVK